MSFLQHIWNTFVLTNSFPVNYSVIKYIHDSMWEMQGKIVFLFFLNCISLDCSGVHYYAQDYTSLHSTAPYWTALNCNALQCTPVHCTAIDCTALYCTEQDYTAQYLPRQKSSLLGFMSTLTGMLH